MDNVCLYTLGINGRTKVAPSTTCFGQVDNLIFAKRYSDKMKSANLSHKTFPTSTAYRNVTIHLTSLVRRRKIQETVTF